MRKTGKEALQVYCKACNIAFKKTISEIERHPNNFCSRSCSATFNNKGRQHNLPKTRMCNKCNIEFKRTGNQSTTICNNCSNAYINLTNSIKKKFIGTYQESASVKNKHPSWKNSHVRALNRSWNSDLIKSGCLICGYTKHVELAHIKPITSFPNTATLGEVNAASNNLPLCRNCHWEFDHDLLDENNALKISAQVEYIKKLYQ